MSNTHYTVTETTILQAIPSFPNNQNNIPNEVLLKSAQDFVELFRRSVQAFNESNRDERFKPCMSQQKHTDTIFSLIERNNDRPIYRDKNIVYQVLFAVSCLMGLPDHKRSWWEQTFARSTEDYLEHTTLFQGSKQQIQTVIRKITSKLQYELDFASTNPTQTAVQQTIDLFLEETAVQQSLLPKVKPKRAKAKPKPVQPIIQLNLFAGQIDAINVDSVNTLNTNIIHQKP